MFSSDGEASLELPVDQWIQPVRAGNERHPAENKEQIPVLPRCCECSEDDLEWASGRKDSLEWTKDLGNLVVDEVVHISAERKDVIVFMDSMRINLSSFCFCIVVPVKIP